MRAHDINEGPPPGGPFDLIHARLLLIHLPRCREVLASLVDALAPGGWLVVGELTDRPLEVLSAPSDADQELFRRMQYLSLEVVSPAVGMHWPWAGEVDGAMVDAGLVDVQARELSRTTVGGSPGCRLHRNLNMQAEPLLRKAGATDGELARYRELMLDPRFRAWFHQFVCTWGRKQHG